MTTVRSPKILSRMSIATLIGATLSAVMFARALWEIHSTSSSRSSRMRSQVEKMSSIAARAI